MKNNLVNKNNLRVLLIGTILILVVSSFGGFFYFFELFSQFYLQYLCGVTIFLIVAIFLRDKISIIISIILISYLSFFVSKATIFQEDITGEVDLYYLNANFYVDKPYLIIDDIQKFDPKYLALIEINPNLYKKINEKLNYKNKYYFNKGVNSYAFFSNEEIISSANHNLSYPVGEIKIKETSIFFIHPLPGLSKELYSAQKNNFKEIINLFNSNSNDSKIILGDFNSSFYSRVFRNYFGKFYYKPIYSRNIKGILRLPIDYAIGNKDFFEINRSNLVVSDHTPLLINFR